MNSGSAPQPEIHWRGDAGYEEARVGPVFNLRRPERYPAGVALPTNESEVVAAVRLARERGHGVTVRGGGHSLPAVSVRDDVLLIDMRRMRELEFEPETGIARVSPSVTGEEFVPFLGERGRMFPGGHCLSVGIGGYLLLGGFGWNGRKLGWACESVVAIDVVTADGELVHSSEEENPELLWAARGAGPGFFGVVTRFYLQTYPAAEAMHQSTYIWTLSEFDEVMTWAHELLPTLDPLVEPVILSTYGPHQFGKWDGVSPDEPLLVMHATTMADTPEQAQELLAPLVACPLKDRAIVQIPIAPTTLAAEYAIQAAGDPPDHRYVGNGIWTDASAAELIPKLKPIFSNLPTRVSRAMWMGWAPHRDQLPDMAFSLEGNVSCSVLAGSTDQEDDVAMEQWVDQSFSSWQSLSKGAYLGDADLSRYPTKFMSDENFARLQELRERHDPDGVFVSYLLPDGVEPNQIQR